MRERMRLADLIVSADPGFASGARSEDGVLQIRMNCVSSDGSLDVASGLRVPVPVNVNRLTLEPGDILFNATNSPALVGKTAVFSGWPEPVTFSNHFLRLRTEPRFLVPAYLARWLQFQWRGRVFQGMCTQWVNQASVRRERLLALRIPLPSLPEQRRIAAILDRADAILRKRQESLRLLDELLRSTFLEMFGDPVRNERGWETVKLGEVADIVGGGTPSRANPAFFNGDVPWATSKDFHAETMSDTEEHLSPAAIAASAAKMVPAGTVLVVVKSKILMRRLPVSLAGVPLCFSQDVKGLVARDARLSCHFLLRHLVVGQRGLLRHARGVNTEGLTLEHLRNYRVVLPPDSHIARWGRYEANLRRIREDLKQQLLDAALLSNALSHWAFAPMVGRGE